MALSSEFVTLVQQEIPEGRQSLSDSHANLEKVAAYCIENFARAENKRMALEETKNYTTQSLASVAYQINTLAYNFLQMIEQQTHQLAEMESQVNYISQMVSIHKEKVARREIGVLTTNKTTARQYKILAPANTEKPIKYVRKAIDFTVLDEIGHGVRSSSSSTPRSRRSTSNVSAAPPVPIQVVPTSAGPAPTTKPPTPPQASRSVSSLSRGSREYRTPPAVAPPQLPSNYAPNYPIGHPRRNDRSSGYSTLPHPSAAHAASQGMNGGAPVPPQHAPAPGPQVGMVHPMAHVAQPGSYTPPPPPPHMHEPPQYAAHPMGMPRYPTVIRPAMTLPKNLTNKNLTSTTASSMTPSGVKGIPHEAALAPPSPASSGVVSEHDYNSRSSGASSPPLPPPPPNDSAEEVPEVPPHYIEKVIAVYDYSADKDDELSFQENAVIYVLKKNDDGWWEGTIDGVTGLFPGNYVEPLM